MSDLTPFDGTPVVRATIQITKAGDGLSEAMKVEPRELHLDDEVYVVLKTTVSRVLFKPLEKDDASLLVRVHTLEAGDATIVDADLVAEAIAQTAEKIRVAKEEEEGVQRIPFGDESEPSEEGHRIQHELGEHEGTPVDGCPICDDVVAAEAAGEGVDPLAEVIQIDQA